MQIQQAVLWSGLLLGSQATDALTRAIDRTRLLEVGGVALFWGFKVLIAASADAALIAAARMVRADHRLSRITFRAALVAVQAVTICLAVTSLSNLAV